MNKRSNGYGPSVATEYSDWRSLSFDDKNDPFCDERIFPSFFPISDFPIFFQRFLSAV